MMHELRCDKPTIWNRWWNPDALPIIVLIGSFLSHQNIILLCSISFPVWNLLSQTLSILEGTFRIVSAQIIRTVCPNTRKVWTLLITFATMNGSLCSWSRYFSILKKVSKNTWASLHLFKSRSVIFPKRNIHQIRVLTQIFYNGFQRLVFSAFTTILGSNTKYPPLKFFHG